MCVLGQEETDGSSLAFSELRMSWCSTSVTYFISIVWVFICVTEPFIKPTMTNGTSLPYANLLNT